jgi:hypothetical protein
VNQSVNETLTSDRLRVLNTARDHAHFWRALALVQFPSLIIAIFGAVTMFFFAKTSIEITEKPQPAQFSVSQLPDSEFLYIAKEVVNRISSFQPITARIQFKNVRRYLWEPALSTFEEFIINKELKVIEDTGRSQMFFPVEELIRVEREADSEKVVVRIPGLKQKLIGMTPVPVEELAYFITMTTIPNNVINRRGVVVTKIESRLLPFESILYFDRKEAKEKKRQGRKKKNASRF